MNKFVCTLVTASVLVSGGFAVAQEKTKSPTDKRTLRDSQMEVVTAGSAIAVGDASVASNYGASVSLSGQVLDGANAVNIVNSSDSQVANGANVFDSSQTSQSASRGAEVKQRNSILQEDNGATAIASVGEVSTPQVRVIDATAAATNIAAENAHVDSTTSYSVDLTGEAEANAKAVDIVNSAGGMVANGVNIAHSSNMNAIPTLAQVNNIQQVR